MKKLLIFLGTVYLVIHVYPLHGQKMDVEFLESELDITLPTQYKTFTQTNGPLPFAKPFGVDSWLFWESSEIIEQTQRLRSKGAISPTDLVFGSPGANQYLLYREVDSSSTKVFHMDDEFDITFYAFGLDQLTLKPRIDELMFQQEEEGYKERDLSQIESCIGCLFDYAFEIQTSEYDDDYSELANAEAMEIFEKCALAGHPEAASQMANHYYFMDEVDEEKVIYWREKAIENGSKEDIFELGEFLIDDVEEGIERGMEWMELLRDDPGYKKRAMLKLSRMYMDESKGIQDYEKGIKYAKELVETGHYPAMADLAFYYYKGMGVEKDLYKSLELLEKASELSLQRLGMDFFSEKIEKVKEEIRLLEQQGKNQEKN